MAPTSPSVDLGSLIDLYDTSDKARATASHNAEILRCIRGGLRMSQQHRVMFDPRQDYWRPPERRFAVAYLAERWTGRFAPATALRSVALDVIRHFDRIRIDGTVTFRGTEYKQVGGFDKIRDQLADHARKLPPTTAWQLWQLRFPGSIPVRLTTFSEQFHHFRERRGVIERRWLRLGRVGLPRVVIVEAINAGPIRAGDEVPIRVDGDLTGFGQPIASD
jgi:hypothetical protein